TPQSRAVSTQPGPLADLRRWVSNCLGRVGKLPFIGRPSTAPAKRQREMNEGQKASPYDLRMLVCRHRDRVPCTSLAALRPATGHVRLELRLSGSAFMTPLVMKNG